MGESAGTEADDDEVQTDHAEVSREVDHEVQRDPARRRRLGEGSAELWSHVLIAVLVGAMQSLSLIATLSELAMRR